MHVVEDLKAKLNGDTLMQPNPWRNGNGNANGGEGNIDSTSKRYLSRVIAVYSGNGVKYQSDVDPVSFVVAACTRAVQHLGTAVDVIAGPAKKERRIMEKARNGNYDAIHDLGRLSMIVHNFDSIHEVVQRVGDCPDFEIIRIKNRLDPDNSAQDSAGYRDCQILVREPRGRWIVEVQIIPGAMYELKRSCGHAGYTKYRFILEACKRARLKTAINTVIAAHRLSHTGAAPTKKVWVLPQVTTARHPASSAGASDPVKTTKHAWTSGSSSDTRPDTKADSNEHSHPPAFQRFNAKVGPTNALEERTA